MSEIPDRSAPDGGLRDDWRRAPLADPFADDAVRQRIARVIAQAAYRAPRLSECAEGGGGAADGCAGRTQQEDPGRSGH